jgi:hypothetical protein
MGQINKSLAFSLTTPTSARSRSSTICRALQRQVFQAALLIECVGGFDLTYLGSA